jgi:predicted MFS family arabinose efflux permease
VTFDRYRTAVRAPGAARLLAWSLVARLPLGMAGLSIVLLVTREHGYGTAGLVTGLYVAASGLSNLLLSRAADRLGARPVLVPAALAYAAAMVVLALIPADRLAWQALAAFVAGATAPPVVAVVRGAWPRLYDPEVAQAIYGLEATAQELVFVLGPTLVALVAGLVGAPAATMLTGVIALIGTWATVLSPGLRTHVGRQAGAPRPSLRATGLPWYLAAGAALVLGFNATEIAVVAFVSGREASAAAGVVLAVWSIGSLVGGLLFGSRIGKADDAGVVRSLLLIGAGVTLTAVAQGPVVLAMLLFVGGMAVAPGLARLYGRVGATAPAGATTEAFSWMTVAMLVGATAGAALGGASVEWWGPRWTLVSAGIPTLLVALVGWSRRRPAETPAGAALPS